MNIKELCKIAVFAAIIAVCAQISIPMPFGVPMTLQTLAIALAGVMLGTKNGTIAVFVYILLGAVGLPVFANLSGGMGVIFGPTGGFILAFPLFAFATAMGAKRGRLGFMGWLVLGKVVLYSSGFLMFSLVTGNSLLASVGFVALPFLPLALVEVAFIGILGKNMRQVVAKSGVL